MAKRKINNQIQPEQATPEQVLPEQEAMETGIENQQEATLKGDEESKTEQSTPEQMMSETCQDETSQDDHIQNWRGLRERTEKAERERDEFFRRLQKLEKTQSNQITPEQAMPELNDDDLVEAKHLKSYIKSSDAKNNQRIALLETQLIESRLKSEYSDFDKVVNVDTLGMLRDVDPELAESITANPNIYSKAVTAYKSIKRYGLISEDHYMKERDKVHANVAKPRPVSSVSPQQGESPLSRANAFAEGLTPELAKELWKEMQQCQKKS